MRRDDGKGHDAVAGSAFVGPREATSSRRRFLALAGLAGVGATAACRGEDRAAAPAASPSASAVPSSSPEPAGLDLAALRRALTGTLVLPGDAAYATAAQPFNVALGVRRPAAIARVASAADVAACIRRAGGRVPVAARSGGHSYAGWSTPDGGLVVDLGALSTVRVASNGTATVGAGARLIDVYAALAAAGRALPAGSCPSVGIGGSTLGGGIGVLTRAYGLTCDHVRAATVVTADGETRTVDGNHDADLYWALRGGGGGNGGIVTEFTFDTVPAPTVTVFSLRFAPERSAAVLAAWMDWTRAAPDAQWSLCGLGAAATPTNRVTGTWTGRPDALPARLDALIDAVGSTPTRRFSQTMRYLDAMTYFAGCSSADIKACHPVSTPGGTLRREAFRAASRILDRPLDAASARKVVQLLAGRAGLTLLIDSLGGSVGRVGVGDTAFPHRRAVASIQVYGGSASAGPAVDAVQRGLVPIVGSGAYVNYLNADQADWGKAYYGENLSRLRSVIKHYDPSGVFTFPQSVLRA